MSLCILSANRGRGGPRSGGGMNNYPRSAGGRDMGGPPRNFGGQNRDFSSPGREFSGPGPRHSKYCYSRYPLGYR